MRFLLVAALLFSVQCFSQNIKTIGVDEFEKNIDSTVQLLDVRKPEEYKAGHLQGSFQANWLDRNEFEERIKHLDKSKPVYVYCLAGSRSAAAAEWLAEKGFANVVNMQGGINAWKKGGKQLETNSSMAQMKDEEYIQLVRSNKLVLVDFGATWCIPCRKMKPVIEKFEKEHPEIKLVTIDAAVEDEIVKKYGVEELPVFIMYKDGKEVWRQEGIVSKKELEKAITK